MKGTVLTMKKKTKKIFWQLLTVSLIMTVIFPLGTIPHTSAAVVESYGSSLNEIDFLNKLGFVSKSYGPKKGEDAVSRGQFANILGYLRGFDENTVNQGTRFMDISADYWCAGQIYSLYDIGLLNGTSVNTFSPNDSITYPQVIKCLVELLGYEAEAKELGGYPKGYLTVANRLGIFAASAADEIDYATIAKLIVKALDTDIMTLKVSVSGGTEFSKSRNQTLLTVYHDIYYDKGIMTDNGITSLTDRSAVGEKSVIINNQILNKGDCNVNDYIGYGLKYYYKEFAGEKPTLLFALPYNTEVMTLNDDELDFDNPDYSFKSIYYDTDKGKKYCKISNNVDVIYNGKAYPEFDLDTLKPNQGFMVLIDNDSDKSYDVISVNEYYDINIAGVDALNEIIFGKYGERLDCSAYDRTEYFYDNGTACAISSFKPNIIASVFESKDGELLKLINNSNGIKGTVESVENYIPNPDASNAAEVESFKKLAKESRFTVSGKEYSLAYDYINAVSKGYQGATMPESGLTYFFRFDINGKIAAIESLTDSQYAYLIYLDYDPETKGKTVARLFLQSGTLDTVSFAKNVEVNGVKYDGQYKSSSSVYNCRDFYEDGKFVRQAVKLKLNASGEISKLETARQVTTNPYGYDSTKFTLCYEGSSVYGGHEQRSIDHSYSFPDDVIIFSIPPDSDFREDEIELLTEKQMSNGSRPWRLYDCDPSWAVKFAVTQATESTDWESRLFIVQSVKKGLLDDDTVGKALVGYFAGHNITTFYEYKPGLIPDNIAKGDVCRIVPGANGKLMNIQVLVSPSKHQEPYCGLPNDYEEWRNYYGQVYAASETGVTLTFDKGKTIRAFTFNKGGTYYIKYDMLTNECVSGSFSDLVSSCPIMEDGTIDLTNSKDMVYIYNRNGWSFGIVILKNVL